MDQLTPAQRAALDRQLDHGERLLWAAGASSGMKAGALLPAGCGLPFLLFGLWPLTVALRNLPQMFEEQSGPIFIAAFGAFGLIFTSMGVLAIAQAIRASRDLAAAVWAVTDRRFMKVVDRAGRRAVEAVPLRLVSGVDVVEYSDGSGTLTLTTDAPHTVRRRGAGPRRGQYQITGVRDAAAARALIQAEVDRAVAGG